MASYITVRKLDNSIRKHILPISNRVCPIWTWQQDGNHKEVSHNEEIVKDEMQKGAHVFFLRADVRILIGLTPGV